MRSGEGSVADEVDAVTDARLDQDPRSNASPIHRVSGKPLSCWQGRAKETCLNVTLDLSLKASNTVLELVKDAS